MLSETLMDTHTTKINRRPRDLMIHRESVLQSHTQGSSYGTILVEWYARVAPLLEPCPCSIFMIIIRKNARSFYSYTMFFIPLCTDKL